ncbi:hypothetical protein TNIN_320991, partial [Trichonephila inaurata madagascariensis]
SKRRGPDSTNFSVVSEDILPYSSCNTCFKWVVFLILFLDRSFEYGSKIVNGIDETAVYNERDAHN